MKIQILIFMKTVAVARAALPTWMSVIAAKTFLKKK